MNATVGSQLGAAHPVADGGAEVVPSGAPSTPAVAAAVAAPGAAVGPAEAPAPTLPAAPPPPPPPGVGARLVAGRGRLGLNLVQAAERLHMEPRMVEALEAETFDLLGAPVYVRGHLRRYAELIGEPAAELLALYAASVAVPDAPPDLTRIPQAEKPAPDSRRITVPLAIALVVAAFAGVIWWVLGASRHGGVETLLPPPPPTAQVSGSATSPAEAPAPSAPESPAASGPAPRSAREAGAAPGATPNAAPAAAAGSAASAAAGAAPIAASARATAAVPPAQPEASPALTEIRLRFTTESWTEVYDADGKRLFYDVATAHSDQRLRGKPPLRVVLGHAPGVSISVNGHLSAIPQRALRDDAAEFVVNRAGRLASER